MTRACVKPADLPEVNGKYITEQFLEWAHMVSGWRRGGCHLPPDMPMTECVFEKSGGGYSGHGFGRGLQHAGARWVCAVLSFASVAALPTLPAMAKRIFAPVPARLMCGGRNSRRCRTFGA